MATSEQNSRRVGSEARVSLGELGEAALHYARNDLPIFPIWNPTENGGCACPHDLFCRNAAKHPIEPLVPHGLQDATTDPDRIREWWGQYPEANIGMPTGAWTGVVVLELDPEKGGFESFSALVRRYGVLPQTGVVHTGGGGLHFYFEHRGTYARDSTGKMGRGLEFHGDGCHVLLPPSVYAKSRTYARQGVWDSEP
jgi:putative DNA primase/helicase